METKEELVSEKVKAGKRTYFIDLCKAKNEKLYLRLNESKHLEKGKFEHHRVIIFEEDIPEVINTLHKVLKELPDTIANQIRDKCYSFRKVRETYPNAYRAWTKEDDDRLEQLYCEKKTVNELSKIFQRNEGAITSRIEKMELKEKYNTENSLQSHQ